jgi:hypothetical protein
LPKLMVGHQSPGPSKQREAKDSAGSDQADVHRHG